MPTSSPATEIADAVSAPARSAEPPSHDLRPQGAPLADLAPEPFVQRRVLAELAAASADLDRRRMELEQAEAQLQAARQALADEADLIRADAERRGLRDGDERGAAQAQEAAQAQRERLAAISHALTRAKQQLLDENEDMLVEIAFTAVCRMLGASAATRAGLASMVRGLIDAEREPATLKVRLHPLDVEQLASGDTGLVPGLSLQADPGIELGGCLIDSPRGTLDARLELQLQQLREALLRARRERGTQEVGV